MKMMMFVAANLCSWLLLSTHVFANTLTGTPGNLNISGNIYDPTPRFSWSSVSGANYYRLAIKQGSTWVVNPEPLPASTSYTLPSANALSVGQCYTWTVRAEQAIGQYGPWASAKSFCIADLPKVTGVHIDSSSYETAPRLDWNNASGALRYRVAVKQGGNWIWNPEPLPSSSYYQTPISDRLVPGQCYTLNVRAEREVGYYGPWSDTLNFCISTLPKVTNVHNDSIAYETAPRLDWNTASGALRYRVAVKQGSTWVWDPEPLPSSSYYQTPIADRLTPGECYTLNVRAEREVGNYGPWSNTYNLCISELGKVTGVTINSPATDPTPSIDWSNQSGALRYRVAVKQGSTWIWNPEPLPTLSQYTPPEEDALDVGCYTLNVRAEREIGHYGDWSTTQNFCIEDEQTTAITVTKPDVNNNQTDFSFDIKWTDSHVNANATIALYYADNTQGSNSRLIVDGILASDPTNSYTWAPKDMGGRSFYIYAKLTDGSTVVQDYASHALTYAPPAPSTLPNVLVVMTDDLDTNSFNQLLQNGYLPNIQARFFNSNKATNFANSFASNPLCCPSRASFLTGQYAQNHFVQNVSSASAGESNGGMEAYHPRDAQGRHTEHRGIADWLNDYRGYYTAMIGKYKNGYGIGSQFVPDNWDYWRGMPQHTLVPKGTKDEYGVSGGYSFVYRNGSGQMVEEFPSDYQTKEIEAQGKTAMDLAQTQNQPFFVYLSPTAPHVEALLDPQDDPTANNWLNDQDCTTDKHPNYQSFLRPDIGVYRNADNDVIGTGYGSNLYTMCDTDYAEGCISPQLNVPNYGGTSFSNFAGAPAFVERKWEEITPTAACNYNGTNALELKRIHNERLESMLSVDIMVGNLFQYLDSKGLTNNTVVIFTSDNGYMLGEHGLGNKGLAYEESIRVPLLVKPVGTPLGTSESKMAVNIDLAPTLLDYAKLPWADQTFNVDGRSLKPLLEQNPLSYVLESSKVAWRKAFLVEAEYPKNIDWCPKPSGIYWTDRPGEDSRWWMFPNYKAVRTDTSFDSRGDMTYIEYWPEPTQASSTQCVGDTDISNGPLDKYLYDMGNDPYQVINRHGSRLYSGRVSALQDVLEQLKGCSGQSCRNAEQ